MTGHNYKKVFFTIDQFKKEVFSAKFKGKYIFCHFAEFDLNGVFGNIKKELDREAVFNGSTFIFAKHPVYNQETYLIDGITYKNELPVGEVMFADSLNIYKTSVKNIGEMMGFPKLERPQKFGQGKKFKITKQDIDYCYRDCDVVWKALEKIFLEVQSVRPTLASLSMIYFRRFYQKYHIAYNELSQRFFESYFGGRVEAFKLGKTFSRKYDINSMYPFVGKDAVFPNPKFIKRSDATDLRGLMYDLEYFEGQATLTVEHKPHNFGFLPIKHEGKLIFPNGIIKGTWCFPEIRFALKHGIIKIQQVHEVLIGTPMKSPFKDFYNDLYNRRKKSTNEIDRTIIKLLMNSNYGKWAQRQKYKEIYFDSIPHNFIDQLQAIARENNITDAELFEVKTFNKQRNDCYIHIYDSVKIEGHKPEYYKVEKDKAGFQGKINTVPVFSSYITSLARVYLLEQMLKYKDQIVTYVDTDCICLEKEITLDEGSELGAFKMEKEIIVEIFGNKNYTELKDKKMNRKIKGVPKKAKLLRKGTKRYEKLLVDKNIEGGDIYTFENFVKTKKSIRHQKLAGTIEKQMKVITNKYDKRKKNKTNGRTKPLVFKK